MPRQNLKQSLHRQHRVGKTPFDLEHTRALVEDVFGEDLHLAWVRLLANGVAGVLSATAASIPAIGRAYSALAGIETKRGIKQVDRMMNNSRLPVEEVLPLWVSTSSGAPDRSRSRWTGRTTTITPHCAYR